MCGIFVCLNHPKAASQVFKGLYAQQHRGQEGAGLVVYNHQNKAAERRRVLGLVGNHPILAKMPGNFAAGHNRYSTQGASIKTNLQPAVFNTLEGDWYLGSNGDIPMYWQIRNLKEAEGWIFKTTNDAELILRLFINEYSKLNFEQTPLKPKDKIVVEALKKIQQKLKGAYSAFLLAPWGTMFIFRDIWGIRPLALGRKDKTLYFASETCAFDIVKAKYERDVQAGEIIKIDQDLNFKSYLTPPYLLPPPAHCIFEFVYFARPDSYIFNSYVDQYRKKMGAKLAQKDFNSLKADVVIAVPDSSNSAAIGYSEESGISFDFGLIRNHYVGRTFILPNQIERDLKVRYKFNPNITAVKDKKIVVVEDSIVRGTTLLWLGRLLRQAGAKEIHIRVCFPPIRHPCYLGMDFGDSKELIAKNNKPIEKIRQEIEADSLKYLTPKELLDCVPGQNYCTGCLNGNYPKNMEVPDKKPKR